MTERYVAVAAILDLEENRVALFPLGYDVHETAERYNRGAGRPEALTWRPSARQFAALEAENRELREQLTIARLDGAMNALGGQS